MGSGFLYGNGGVSLNFDIIGGTAKPLAPKENTIWLNTSSAINDYQFSAFQPTAQSDGGILQSGNVWIQTETMSQCGFNILNKNSAYVYPIFAFQFDGTAWQSVEAEIYKTGTWNSLTCTIWENGNINSVFGTAPIFTNTGSNAGSNTFNTNGVTMISSSSAYTICVCSVNRAINANLYTRLELTLTYGKTSLMGGCYFGLSTSNTQRNALIEQGFCSYTTIGNETLYSLDISGITNSSCYPFIWWYSGTGSNTSFYVRFKKMQLI